MKIKKILIMRFSSIGDIVLTTPLVRALKHQRVDVEIHYCTKEFYRIILDQNPYIDRIIPLKNSLYDLIRSLRRENYDYIIDLHKNLRTFIIKKSLGIPTSSFNKLNFQKWLMVNLKINKLPNKHIVERYMESVQPLGIKPDNQGLDYFIPDRDIMERGWLPPTHRKEYVAFAIGARHNTKKLPFKKMVQLCDMINKPVILLGDESDWKLADRLERFFKQYQNETYEEGLQKLNKKTIIFNACGKLNLNQSASIIKGASHVFTHDSGLMHIAAAFKKSLYTIWGNTIPLFGMYPYKTTFTIFENNKVYCRPCSKLGHRKCPRGHFKCMKDIVFDFYLP